MRKIPPGLRPEIADKIREQNIREAVARSKAHDAELRAMGINPLEVDPDHRGAAILAELKRLTRPR